MTAQRLDPFEQAVGAFDSLERDGAAADRNCRLADIERADRARGGSGGLDVAPVAISAVETPAIGPSEPAGPARSHARRPP